MFKEILRSLKGSVKGCLKDLGLKTFLKDVKRMLKEVGRILKDLTEWLLEELRGQWL